MIKTTLLNLFFGAFNIANFWKMDYINRWDLHITDFWVPAIVGIIFLICCVQALSKKKIFLVILYFVLFAACFGVIGMGSESTAINAVEGLVGH